MSGDLELEHGACELLRRQLDEAAERVVYLESLVRELREQCTALRNGAVSVARSRGKALGLPPPPPDTSSGCNS
jgi:hypothetical protein